MIKKWFLITYRLTGGNGPYSKWVGNELLFSEIEEDSLVRNTVKHLNGLHEARTPVVDYVESLNEDGTKSLILDGSMGSKLYKACFDFHKV